MFVDKASANHMRVATHLCRRWVAELRARYLEHVDGIAMQFGVAEALKVKKQVEKDVDDSERIRCVERF